MLTACMLMTCIRSDQSSVSHRFEANALIGENITELRNGCSGLRTAELGAVNRTEHMTAGLCWAALGEPPFFLVVEPGVIITGAESKMTVPDDITPLWRLRWVNTIETGFG